MVERHKCFCSLALFLVLLCFHDSLAFAGQGCCSAHGGVAGCAGAKLKCNDGTVSPTCSCQDGSSAGWPMPRAQNGLALLEPTLRKAKPYVTPVGGRTPEVPIETVPSLQGDKPYVTPAAPPEAPAQGDTVPSQKPPKPYSAQEAPTKKNVGQYQPPPQELPAFPGTVRDKPKTPFAGGGKRARWRTPDGDILEWDYQHGRVEKYNKQGKHKGEYDPNTGQQTKPTEPGRKIEP